LKPMQHTLDLTNEVRAKCYALRIAWEI